MRGQKTTAASPGGASTNSANSTPIYTPKTTPSQSPQSSPAQTPKSSPPGSPKSTPAQTPTSMLARLAPLGNVLREANITIPIESTQMELKLNVKLCSTSETTNTAQVSNGDASTTNATSSGITASMNVNASINKLNASVNRLNSSINNARVPKQANAFNNVRVPNRAKAFNNARVPNRANAFNNARVPNHAANTTKKPQVANKAAPNNRPRVPNKAAWKNTTPANNARGQNQANAFNNARVPNHAANATKKAQVANQAAPNNRPLVPPKAVLPLAYFNPAHLGGSKGKGQAAKKTTSNGPYTPATVVVHIRCCNISFNMQMSAYDLYKKEMDGNRFSKTSDVYNHKHALFQHAMERAQWGRRDVITLEDVEGAICDQIVDEED